jgi:rsbT antagonist protein RsbS
MDFRSSVSGMYIIKKCLIVPVMESSDEGVFKNIGKEALNRLKETDITGVLIDVSTVSILSSYGFSILKNISAAISMMGASTVFVGFQPGVASSLVDLNLDLSNINTALTTEDALMMLDNSTAKREQTDEDQNSEEEENLSMKESDDQ